MGGPWDKELRLKDSPLNPHPRQTPGKHSPARPIIVSANPGELRSSDSPDVVKVI